MRRVTFVVYDLAGSSIGRAVPLAAALARDHDVEATGLLAPGADLYLPYRDALPIVPVRGSARNPFSLFRLSRRISADVVVACKPLPGTLLPALAAGQRLGVPVILDVDDDEWSESTVERTGLRGTLARRADLHATLARGIHPLVRRIDAVTVSTRALQRRYGGTIVRHGPDPDRFHPARFGTAARTDLRARLGVGPEVRLALFAGVPRQHKGWTTLVEALALPAAAGWNLLAIGARGNAWHRLARLRLGPRFHWLPGIPHGELPSLLAGVDAVPIPQRRVPFAECQLPAKLMDAMAMALPVVATDVGDLPEILGDGARGWIVPPDHPGALAAALAEVEADPAAAARRGAAARNWFLAEASTAANRPRLGAVLHEALGRRGLAGSVGGA